MPTQGFNIKTLVSDGFKLNVWDIGGQREIREYWTNYTNNTDGLIYVVDSSDSERMKESKEAFDDLLTSPALSGVPTLIFANKQDIATAKDTEEIMEDLCLDELSGRRWQAQACSAVSKEGLEDGIAWMVDQVYEAAMKAANNKEEEKKDDGAAADKKVGAAAEEEKKDEGAAAEKK